MYCKCMSRIYTQNADKMFCYFSNIEALLAFILFILKSRLTENGIKKGEMTCGKGQNGESTPDVLLYIA